MLLFWLLCPILIYPLAKQIRKYGFTQTHYGITALVCWILGGILGSWINSISRKPQLWILALPLCGIILNHFLYLIVGSLSTKREIDKREEALVKEDMAINKRMKRIDEIMQSWLCIKTYVGSEMQLEFNGDIHCLETNDIKYFVKSSGITNLYIHPDYVERACLLLGIDAEIASADDKSQ